MDWARAIQRNSEALSEIIATLFAMLGLARGSQGGWISRALHRAILGILRPAESAVRRLIVIAAKDLVVKLPPPRPGPRVGITGRRGTSRPAFPLFDPARRPGGAWRQGFAAGTPRIHFFDRDPRIAALWARQAARAASAAPPEPRIDARRLLRRLEAVALALEDLPRQARRLARLRARQAREPGARRYKPPLRPGKPPGYRRIPRHDVDHVLGECHVLARDVLERDVLAPDTS